MNITIQKCKIGDKLKVILFNGIAFFRLNSKKEHKFPDSY